MNVKSHSKIAIAAAITTIIFSFSACTTQERNTPDTTRTRYQQQVTTGNTANRNNTGNNAGSNIANNGTGNTGMRFDATPETQRTVTGVNIRSGNNNNNNSADMNNNNNGNGNFLGLGNNNNGQTPQTAAGPSDRSKAASIERGLEAMSGINNVKVVVMGDTAIVAYGRQNGADNPKATNETITAKVKQIDPTIKNVYTSDSADISEQVSRLSNDMTNNRPMDEIRDSFNKLINTINPNTNTNGRS